MHSAFFFFFFLIFLESGGKKVWVYTFLELKSFPWGLLISLSYLGNFLGRESATIICSIYSMYTYTLYGHIGTCTEHVPGR